MIIPKTVLEKGLETLGKGIKYMAKEDGAIKHFASEPIALTEKVVKDALKISDSRSEKLLLSEIKMSNGTYDNASLEFVQKLKHSGVDHMLLPSFLESKCSLDPSKFDEEAFKAFDAFISKHPMPNFGYDIDTLVDSIGKHGEFSKADLEDLTKLMGKYKSGYDRLRVFNFRKYRKVKDIDELSLSEKNEFLTRLVSNGFSENICADIPCLPKTKEEYSKMVKKLLADTSFSVKPLEKTEQTAVKSVLAHIGQGGELSATQIEQLQKAFPEVLVNGKISDSSLALLQKLSKDGRFAELSNDDKLTLQLAVLFKDSSSIHGLQDVDQSAFNAFYLGDKLNLSHENKLKLFAIVKNQNLFGDAMNGKITMKSLENVGCQLRYNDSYKMLEIFSDASKNQGKIADKELLSNIKDTIRTQSSKFNKLYKGLIPKSKVPKASQFIVNGDSVQKVTKDGIENIVVYFDKKTPIKYIDESGIERILEPKDVHNLYHATTNFSGVELSSRPNSHYAISSSYTAPTEASHALFGTEGMVLGMNDADIYYARTFRDAGGTGFGKKLSASQYSYGQQLDENFRHLQSVYEKYGYKSLETLRKEDPKAAEELHKAIVAASPKCEYGEVIGGYPEPLGVFFQGPYKGYSPMYEGFSKKHEMSTTDKAKSLICKMFGKDFKETYKFDEMPQDMRKYASDKDFAVFHLGD